MLEPAKPSDLGLGDAVLLREEGHASAERGFPCAALFEGVRCYAAALAGWMGFQELNVRSYRELDPLRLDVGVLMIASLERRALPLDFPSSRRRGEQLGHDRFAVFCDHVPDPERDQSGMQLALWQACSFGERNSVLHFPRDSPIFAARVGNPPIMSPLTGLVANVGHDNHGQPRITQGGAFRPTTTFVKLDLLAHPVSGARNIVCHCQCLHGEERIGIGLKSNPPGYFVERLLNGDSRQQPRSCQKSLLTASNAFSPSAVGHLACDPLRRRVVGGVDPDEISAIIAPSQPILRSTSPDRVFGTHRCNSTRRNHAAYQIHSKRDRAYAHSGPPPAW